MLKLLFKPPAALVTGDFVIINDHLNLPGLAGKHPLVGPNLSEFGPRFLPLNKAYDPELQDIAYNEAAKHLNLQNKVRRGGVYCFVSGPTYESPAEARFLKM